MSSSSPGVLGTSPRFVWLGILLASAVSSSGCQEATTALVTGTVTMDGEPAKVGAISFFPIDNKGTPVGAKITNGKYEAHVPFGEKKVDIRVSKVVGKRRLYDTPDSPVKEVLSEALPPKYNTQSELRLEVKPGEIVQDYHLQTKDTAGK